METQARGRRFRRPVTDLPIEELSAIVDRAKVAVLSETEHTQLRAAMETLVFLTQELQRKNTSLKRLRQMLFGSQSEKTEKVLGTNPTPNSPAGEDATPPAAEGDPKAKDDAKAKAKREGHGRAGAAAYTGAEQVPVPHPLLHRGDGCPGCETGKVYPLSEPAKLVRITGMAPLGARVYSCDRLRCNLCGEVFTAPAPEGVGPEKYDETASSMVGLLKYGTGLPFNRIEKLQAGMGIPLPAATQWGLVKSAAEVLAPAHQELIRQAAQGEVLHNDDTTMKVLQISKEERAAALGDEQRKGVFTSGIVSVGGGHTIALFFTGVKHAGENLADVLAQRAVELPTPIQMCDALPANTSGDFKTILANCNAHARRGFVEVAENFPEEVRLVLETFAEVYRNDDIARKKKMTPLERLQFHQENSGPRMEKLQLWANQQLDEKKVEPHSGLGEALGYLLKHWKKLTLFLKVPGAPLDNNICERVLKKAILHRKNAYFYRTLNGAKVGDLFMSLIHTAELNGVHPFDYLVALQRYSAQVKEKPSEWMPWNYESARARLESPHVANDAPGRS